MRRPWEALTVCQQLARSPTIPEHTRIYLELNRARVMTALDSLDPARTHLPKVLEVNEAWSHTQCNMVLAGVEVAANDASAAFAALEQATRYGEPVRPGLAWARMNRLLTTARAHVVAGRVDDAITAYRDCIRVFGSWTEARYELGVLYENERRFAEAVAEYEACLQLWADADPGFSRVAETQQRLQRAREVH